MELKHTTRELTKVTNHTVRLDPFGYNKVNEFLSQARILSLLFYCYEENFQLARPETIILKRCE